MPTQPIKVIRPWYVQLWRKTVWHPINTDPEDDDRWTVRVWLPLYDFLVITAGIIAYTIGSPILNRLFPDALVNAASAVFIFLGVITLFGVCFPFLWRVEIGGKVGVSFMLMSYALLVLSFPSPGNDTAFVSVILIMATWGVYPRLTKLFARGVRARNTRKAQAAHGTP